MKKIIGALTLFIVISTMQAQNTADSLINILSTHKLTPAEQLSIYDQLRGFYSENDVDKSNLYARKGLVLAEKEQNKALASVFYGQIGVNYYTKSNYDTAIVYLEKALVLAIEIKDRPQEASANTDIGNSYRRQGRYKEALENYMRAMAINDSIGDKGNVAIAMINIGGIHESLRDFGRAEHFLRQAEAISNEMDIKNLQMSVYYRLGLLYIRKEKYREAIEFALKSKEISRSFNNRKYEIATLKLLVTAHAHMKNYDKSMEYANECIHLAEKYDDKRLLMGVLIELSDIYMQQFRYGESAGLSSKAWGIDSTDLIYGTDAAWNLSMANIHLGNKGKAVYFMERFNDLVTKRTDKNSHEALIDMEVKYETEKKELRIATLEKEKQLYIWLSVAGGIVLLLAFGTLFYRHRMNVQRRRVAEQQRELAEQQVKQLEQEKQLIATQAVLEGEASERSRLARDLHDGLGGLLSVVKLNMKEVKGFAVMDGTDVEHFGKALKMLDESIGELRRVAHHIMPESLMRYGLRVALEDFCRAITVANFQYYGNNPRLDSRQEVLVYRCAHELVNNAVKHAGATAINVQLIADNNVVSLTIHDNGCGFDPGTITPGAGLENIRTRVSAYNGRMNIHSAPGKGTEVSIEIERNDK